MIGRVFQAVGKYQAVKGGLGALPAWARFCVLIAAVPGIVLIALSILVFGVSILALLLLTVPMYRLVSFLSGSSRRQAEVGETFVIVPPTESDADSVLQQMLEPDPPRRRHVNVTIIDDGKK